MDRSVKFWDKIAKRYAAGPVRDKQSYDTKLAKTQTYFTPESNVLELACGTGTTALIHAPYVSHIHATDFSSGMIAICRDKAKVANITNITFECIGIDALEKPADSVDVVMMHSILHLLPDIPAVLNKVKGMLKPGGVLVTSTACLGEAAWYWHMLISVAHALRLAPFINYFTQQELENWLLDTGYTLDHVWRPHAKQAAFIIARKAAD